MFHTDTVTGGGGPSILVTAGPEAEFPFPFLDLTLRDLGIGIGLWTGTGPLCSLKLLKQKETRPFLGHFLKKMCFLFPKNV